MSSPSGEPESGEDPGPPGGCPLARREQTRNLLLFAANTALSYLASPVTFIVIHAPLCKRLGGSATVANLPSSSYLLLAVLPVVVAWRFPQVALFKRVLVISYLSSAAATALVAAALLTTVPAWVKIAALILHGAVNGGALSVAVSFLFEVVGRGVSEARRGQALGLAYGIGPVFAVAGSFAPQLVLAGREGDDAVAGYALLFALAVPILGLAAFLASRFVVPPATAAEPPRRAFLAGVFGGLGAFFHDPVLRAAAVAAVLVFAGYHVFDNLTLYTQEALGRPPEEYVGYQNGLRFGFKIGVGLFAGWLLARTHPRAVLAATLGFGLAGVAWALWATGTPYLVAFGLLGGGELFGVYVTNYILARSPPTDMRRNMGFAVMLLVPAAAAGPLFGGIADYFGDTYSREAGFRLSFAVALAFLGAAFLLTLRLPARPRPEAAPEPFLPEKSKPDV